MKHRFGVKFDGSTDGKTFVAPKIIYCEYLAKCTGWLLN